MDDRAALDRLAEAISDVRVNDLWKGSADLVKDERERVMGHLAAHPETSVYGFTTLLGPLDRYESSRAQVGEVLRAHLVGSPRPVDPVRARAIHGAKISQLSCGGTGVSREAYLRVLDTFGRCFATDLAASYGSADVVPASWWVNEVIGLGNLDRGDLIALISGSFVGAGVAVVALARYERVLFSAVARLAGVCDVHPQLAPDGWQRELLSGLAAGQSRGGRVQRSVFQRDLGAHLLPVVRTVLRAELALDEVLSRPSANPLFILEESGVTPVSQSSFLALDLRMCLDAVLSGAELLSGLLQRCAEFGGCSADDLQMRWVQPPKVSQAISLQVGQQVRGIPFTGSQSGGVEDLWDGVLVRARDLDAVVELLQAQLDILDNASDERLDDQLVADRLSSVLHLSRDHFRMVGSAPALAPR